MNSKNWAILGLFICAITATFIVSRWHFSTKITLIPMDVKNFDIVDKFPPPDISPNYDSSNSNQPQTMDQTKKIPIGSIDKNKERAVEVLPDASTEVGAHFLNKPTKDDRQNSEKLTQARLEKKLAEMELSLSQMKSKNEKITNENQIVELVELIALLLSGLGGLAAIFVFLRSARGNGNIIITE